MQNFELVQTGFNILLPLMANYIGQEFKRVYGNDCKRQILSAISGHPDDLSGIEDYQDLINKLDIANCLRLIERKWAEVFRAKLSRDYKSWAGELMGVRNTLSHKGSEDFKPMYSERALNTMALLCEAFDAEGTEKIRELYRKLRYGSEAGSTAGTMQVSQSPNARKPVSSGVLQKHFFAGQNLPSWRDIMQPHPDVAGGRYRNAEFAADLNLVAQGRAAVEYRDPVEFFNRTYMTIGMKGLLSQAIDRLSGKGGEPVIQLKTAFGGGKTHSMLALYHIAHGIPVEKIPSIKEFMQEIGITSLPQAHVAVIVGTALDPAKRKNPGNLPGNSVSTVWGEIAYQLVTSAGKPELYAKIKESDRKGTSPGSETLKELFNACGPCLILMDEIVAYAKKLYGIQGLPAGTYDNFITFIQEITEAAKASDNSIVIASIPESDIEVGGEAGHKVLDTIEHTFGRMEAIWKPVAANEGFEVVRRRLFSNCNDEAGRDAVCAAFSQMYRDNAAEYPSEAKELEYFERLKACYPIHPEVFDRLYDDWATLERFQRTRGVLRLMAAVIHELWMANDAEPMIMPGSLPLDMPNVKNELTRYLDENWNSIVDREVDGKNSLPYQLDKNTERYGKNIAARRVARTIMLGSAPRTVAATPDQTLRGLEKSRIHLGVMQPGESIAVFNDALSALRGNLSYLYSSANDTHFWFDTHPTLRKLAKDRALQFSDTQIDDEIKIRLYKLRKEPPFAGIHIVPNSSQDIPDDQSARLVILGTKDVHKKGKENSQALLKVKDILDNRGTNPRTYRNMLIFLAPDTDELYSLQQEIRNYKAWDSIIVEKDDLNLDAVRMREAEDNLRRSNDEIGLRLQHTYKWLFVPLINLDENMRTIQWEIEDLGSADEAIVSKAARYVQQNEIVIDRWASSVLKIILDSFLWKNDNHISVKKLWEQLCTYCYLPRLKNKDVLEQAVLKGVRTGEYFALAAGYSGECYVDLRYKKDVSSLYDSDLLVKIDVALKQLEKEIGIEGPGRETNPHEGNPPTQPVGGTGTAVPERRNKHFHMVAKLDNVRINKNVNDYVQEVIQHLINVDGSTVNVKLVVEATADNGIPSSTVRTVSENCQTLRAEEFSFDD